MVELHFVELNSDNSFVLHLEDNATPETFIFALQHECLIPLPHLHLVDENGQPLITPWQIQPKQLLKQTCPWFVDGNIISFSDGRFSPASPQERQQYSKSLDVPTAQHLLNNRPLLFRSLFTDAPKITQMLPSYVEQLLLIPPDNIFLQTVLLSRSTLSGSWRVYFWKTFLERIIAENEQPQSEQTRNKIDLANEELRFANGQNDCRQAYEYALEHNPELFGSVDMLFVPLQVNGLDICAFVDCGAQNTIMSHNFARFAKIDHLIDDSRRSFAQGVGTGRILGVIHAVKFKFGSEFIPISVHVMQHLKEDVLLGLDTLKRYQMNINLQTNNLEMPKFGDIPAVHLQFLPFHKVREYHKQRNQEIQRETRAIRQQPQGQFILPRSPLDFPGDYIDDDDDINDDDDDGLPHASTEKVSFGPTTMSAIQTILKYHKDILPVLKRIDQAYELDMIQAQHNPSNVSGKRPDAHLLSQYQTGGLGRQGAASSSTAAPAPARAPAAQNDVSDFLLPAVPPTDEEATQLASDEEIAETAASLLRTAQTVGLPHLSLGQLEALFQNVPKRTVLQTRDTSNQLLQQYHAAQGNSELVSQVTSQITLFLLVMLRSTTASAAAAQRTAPEAIPDNAKVRQLVAFGYPKAAVERILSLTNNDLDMTVAQLESMRDDGELDAFDNNDTYMQ